jgi:uncharacterized protein YerC
MGSTSAESLLKSVLVVLNSPISPIPYRVDRKCKINEMNSLDRRFSVAPMMDWTDRAEKAKRSQYLSMVAASHVVPNAVPRR